MFSRPISLAYINIMLASYLLCIFIGAHIKLVGLDKKVGIVATGAFMFRGLIKFSGKVGP